MDAIQVSEGLSRLVARVCDSYPFVAVTKALANKRLEVVAPSGAQPWILSAIGDLRKDKNDMIQDDNQV